MPDTVKGKKKSLTKRLGRKSSSRTLFNDFIGGTEEFTSSADGLSSQDDHTPIADLYPETTIMLLDLVGFTAWSSAREPSAVFLLLESIFSCFDELAKRRRVFKVETVGGKTFETGVVSVLDTQSFSYCRNLSKLLRLLRCCRWPAGPPHGPRAGHGSVRQGLSPQVLRCHPQVGVHAGSRYEWPCRSHWPPFRRHHWRSFAW